MTLRDIVSQIMDEETYVANDPVLAAAVNAGEITAVDHFINHGLEEGRTNINPLYSENFYLSTYLDIAAAVTANAFFSGLHHYLTNITENRAPSETFSPTHYLDTYADIVAAGVIPILHFYSGGGMLEKRKANPETRLDNVTDPTFLAAHAAQDLSALANSIVQLSSSNSNNNTTPPTPPTPTPANTTPVISTGIGVGAALFTTADNENITGTNGDDSFDISINPLTFNANDSLDGGGGNNTILVSGGAFPNIVNFDNGNVTNIQAITVDDNADNTIILMPSNLSVTATGGTGTDLFSFDASNKTTLGAGDIFDGGTGDDDNAIFVIGGTGNDTFDITGAGALTNIQEITVHDGGMIPGLPLFSAAEILIANAASIAGLVDITGGSNTEQTLRLTDTTTLINAGINNVDLEDFEIIELAGDADLTIGNSNLDQVETIRGSAGQTNIITFDLDPDITGIDFSDNINGFSITLNRSLNLDGGAITNIAGGTITGNTGNESLIFTGSGDLSQVIVSDIDTLSIGTGSSTSTVDVTVSNANLADIDNISGTGIPGISFFTLFEDTDLTQVAFGITAIDTLTLTNSINVTVVNDSINSITNIVGSGNDTISVVNDADFSGSITSITGVRSITDGGTANASVNITGSPSNDSISGLGGNDNLNGGGGDDTIVGGEDQDFIDPGTGNDSVDLTETVAMRDAVNLNTGYFVTIGGFAPGGNPSIHDEVQWVTVPLTDEDTGATTTLFTEIVGNVDANTISSNNTSAVLEFEGAADVLSIDVSNPGVTANDIEVEVAAQLSVITVGNNTNANLLFMNYDNAGNLVISNFINSGNNTSIDASEVEVIAILLGVTGGSFEPNDIAL